MPAEVNGNHAVARFDRARAILNSASKGEYFVCGNIVLTPSFVFMSGHANEDNGFDPVVSIAVPREEVRIVIDHSVEPCEMHDKMDAEARAQMESLSAEENQENG